MELAVETDRLVKVYRDRGSEVKALDEVSLRVPAGSIFGIFGPNGSGKTTLISILLGLILPTRGSARVLGYDVVKQSLSVRKRVGLLPEAFGLYEHMTALDNLVFFGLLDEVPKGEVEKRAREVLELVGLSDKAGAKVSTFSRGMIQRLGLAQVLMKDPDLVILDEPTMGLDPDGIELLKNLVLGLRERGKTIMISTHLLHEVGNICTHAAIIRKGKVLAQGSLEEVTRELAEKQYSAYAVRRTDYSERLLEELRSLPEVIVTGHSGNTIRVLAKNDRVSALIEVAEKHGAAVEPLTYREVTWEDVYRFYQGGARW